MVTHNTQIYFHALFQCHSHLHVHITKHPWEEKSQCKLLYRAITRNQSLPGKCCMFRLNVNEPVLQWKEIVSELFKMAFIHVWICPKVWPDLLPSAIMIKQRNVFGIQTTSTQVAWHTCMDWYKLIVWTRLPTLSGWMMSGCQVCGPPAEAQQKLGDATGQLP